MLELWLSRGEGPPALRDFSLFFVSGVLFPQRISDSDSREKEFLTGSGAMAVRVSTCYLGNYVFNAHVLPLD